MLVHPLTLAEVLVGGVRVGRGQAMRDDLDAAGIRVVAPDAGEPLRLAELRVSTGLRLPDCCVLDLVLRGVCSLATFDAALAAGRGNAEFRCRRDLLDCTDQDPAARQAGLVGGSP